MVKTKLILIDGITGSGKSTTAQFLWNQLNKNGIKVKWFHETQTNHPLALEEDIEVFSAPVEADQFIDRTKTLWQQLVRQIENDDSIYIIESFLLQDTVRILFQNHIEKECILTFVKEVEACIESLNPILFYFHQTDVNHAIRKIWKRRGEVWKKWFIDSDIQTPYVKTSGMLNEEGVIKLWSDYQDFTNELYNNYQIEKLSIENSKGQWRTYHHQMLDTLELECYDEAFEHDTADKQRYCGRYKENDGTLECTIDLLNGELVCDLIWPNIRICRTEKEDLNLFYLESFPVMLKAEEREDKTIKSICLSGEKKEYDGKILDKIC